MPFFGPPLLSARFWFTIAPLALPFETTRILAIAAVGCFIVGMFLRSFLTGESRGTVLLRAASTPVIWTALVFLALLFLSYEQVYLFGAPFWYLGACIIFFVWLGVVAWRVFVRAPRLARREREGQRISKYFPKKKA